MQYIITISANNYVYIAPGSFSDYVVPILLSLSIRDHFFSRSSDRLRSWKIVCVYISYVNNLTRIVIFDTLPNSLQRVYHWYSHILSQTFGLGTAATIMNRLATTTRILIVISIVVKTFNNWLKFQFRFPFISLDVYILHKYDFTHSLTIYSLTVQVKLSKNYIQTLRSHVIFYRTDDK